MTTDCSVCVIYYRGRGVFVLVVCVCKLAGCTLIRSAGTWITESGEGIESDLERCV